jgi:hypothetical protein
MAACRSMDVHQQLSLKSIGQQPTINEAGQGDRFWVQAENDRPSPWRPFVRETDLYEDEFTGDAVAGEGTNGSSLTIL